MAASVARIEALQSESLTATSAEEGKAAAKQLQEESGGMNVLAKKVRAQLKAMDAANQLFAKKNPGASEARIRTNMHATLSRKFVESMAEYQEVQARFKSKHRERMARQYRMVQPSISQEEIDAALDGGGQEEVFSQTVLQGPGHAQARQELSDIQERHRDMLRLEGSIAELHQLFLDMSVLVEAQGELLDQVEYTVAQSVDYTGRAVDELRSAAYYQAQARKKCCCVVVTLLIVVGVVVLTLYFRYVAPDGGDGDGDGDGDGEGGDEE